MARVEDHRDAAQAPGLDLVAELGARPQARLVLLALGVPFGQELGLQKVERNAHPEADGNRGDVRNAAAVGDLLRQGVDVGGEDAAGEAHHHRGVQGLVRPQTVDGVVAILVHPVIEQERPLRHRQGRAEGGQQQLGGNGQRRVLRQLFVVQLVVLADGAEVLARPGKPLGHPPETLALHQSRSAHFVAPALGDALIVREQGLHRLELQVLGEQCEGDGVADAGEEILVAAVGLGDLRRQARVAAQPAGEEAQALAPLGNRLDEDAAIFAEGGDQAVAQRDANRAGSVL